MNITVFEYTVLRERSDSFRVNPIRPLFGRAPAKFSFCTVEVCPSERKLYRTISDVWCGDPIIGFISTLALAFVLVVLAGVPMLDDLCKRN